MAEVEVKLRAYYKKVQEIYPVMIVVRASRQRVWLNTGVYVPIINWNEAKTSVKNLPNARDLNLIIEEHRSRIDEILIRYRLQNRKITPDQLRKEYANPGIYSDFIKYARDFVKNKKGIDSPNTISSINSIIKKLEEFKAVIEFRDLDDYFFNEYRKHLKNKLGNNANTIHKNFTWLKAIIDKAISDKIITENPINKMKLSKSQTDPVHLSREELLKLWDYYCRDMFQENHKTVCRYYLFSCFTGLRLSDVKRITKKDIDGEEIVLRPLKTKNTTNEIVRIPLNSFAKKLIADAINTKSTAIFNIYADQVTNRYLKKIADGCSITKDLKFHSGRHTFATIYLELNPGDVAGLQKLLGHGSIDSTMVYIHIDDTAKRDRMKKFEELK